MSDVTEEECSDACTRNICEWCPEADREASLVAAFRTELDALPGCDQ